MEESKAWEILNRDLYFVKDVVKSHEAKTSDKFDVFDPESGNILLECREPDIGVMTKVTRFLGGRYDEMAPFNLIAVVPESNEQVLRIARGSSFVTAGGSAIEYSDQNDHLICRMKKPFFSFGLAFRFYREKKDTLFVMRIKSVLNGYKMIIDKKEVARVMLKWKKEHSDVFKANKCKYAISFSPDVPKSNVARQVILALAISIDRVKK